MDAGRFRADLYHRLAVFPMRVPSLADRRADIPALAAHFADLNRRRLGLGSVRFNDEALAELAGADWPGNVRELENVVSRAGLRAAAGQPPHEPVAIGLAHLDRVARVAAAGAPEAARETPHVPAPLREQVDAFQRQRILDAVTAHDGNWAAAARALGMHRSNLHQLAGRLGIRKPR